MDKLRKLRGKRAKALSDAKSITATAAKEERLLTAEEREQFDILKAEIEALDLEIKTLESLVELERTAPAQTLEIIKPEEPKPETKLPEITGGRDRILDDPYRGFPAPEAGGIGTFLHAVIQAGRQGRNDPFIGNRRETRLINLVAAAGADEQHGDSQIWGGYLVPIGFVRTLLMVDMEEDPTRGVTIIPMSAPTVMIPARVDKNHTVSVAGGLTVAWRPQTALIGSSRMQFEQIMLTAHSLAGIAYVTNELLQDSAISFAALLEAGFRDAILDAIIRARISGTGVGEPMGILNSPSLVTVSTSGQTTGTITGANILAMRQRSWRYSRAVWLANHDTYTQLAAVHVLGTNSDMFFFNPARGIDVPDTLLGRPIFFTEYASTLGTVGDIMLCTWSEYLVGNLQGPQMAESMHVRFETNEMTFRITIRQAGEPWWRSALTPVNSAETLSPFVALQTRTA